MQCSKPRFLISSLVIVKATQWFASQKSSQCIMSALFVLCTNMKTILGETTYCSPAKLVVKSFQSGGIDIECSCQAAEWLYRDVCSLLTQIGGYIVGPIRLQNNWKTETTVPNLGFECLLRVSRNSEIKICTCEAALLPGIMHEACQVYKAFTPQLSNRKEDQCLLHIMHWLCKCLAMRTWVTLCIWPILSRNTSFRQNRPESPAWSLLLLLLVGAVKRGASFVLAASTLSLTFFSSSVAFVSSASADFEACSNWGASSAGFDLAWLLRISMCATDL